MTAPIALQLYSVREALPDDFTGVVQRIADIGYVGVEPALGHLGTTPQKAAKLFRELGLEVPSTHAPLPIGADKNKVLDFAAALGCKLIFSGKEAKDFGTTNLIKQTCALFNEAHTVATENGMSFGIHTHWWEFQQVEGRYVYQVMLEHLEPGVLFQLDTYWIQTAGVDPAKVVQEFGARAPSLHIKDGPAVRDVPQVAIGDGVLDFPSIIQAADDTTEWLIVELDECATDMLEAVEKSYRYLVGEGLAHGNKG